jgi:hypothetical protein
MLRSNLELRLNYFFKNPPQGPHCEKLFTCCVGESVASNKFRTLEQVALRSTAETRSYRSVAARNEPTPSRAGLPDFSWCTKWPQSIPNGHKVYQMATKYTKWPQSIPNGHKVYQMPRKYTKCPEYIPNGFIHKYQTAIEYTKPFHSKAFK